MKEDTLKEELYNKGAKEEEIRTVQYESIMTQQFTQTYKEALKFSNLQLDNQLKYRNVSVHGNQHMHELYTVSNKHLPHLVLLHGYGGTSLTFIRTFQHLKDHFQVHALDTFGVGLSSRGSWKQDMTPEQTGNYYIQAIQEWRKNIQIEEFYLVGHSFGGYISTLYLQKYPERVKHLMLLSPAGSGKMSDQDIQRRARGSKFFFCIAEKLYNMNIRPSRIMNACFIGNKFIERILQNRLKLPQQEKSAWKKYLKHISKIQDSSEHGFYTLFQWPLQPLRSIESILTKLKTQIRIDFFFGDSDWMNRDGALKLQKQFKNIQVHYISDAGHQLIFDNPIEVSNKIKQLHSKK